MTKEERVKGIKRIIDNKVAECYAKINPIGSESVNNIATAIEEAIGVEILIKIPKKMDLDNMKFPEQGVVWNKCIDKIASLNKGISTNKEVIKINDKR